MPDSSARWMMRIDSSWSVSPQAPNIIAPRQSGLTFTPVWPNARGSMADETSDRGHPARGAVGPLSSSAECLQQPDDDQHDQRNPDAGCRDADRRSHLTPEGRLRARGGVPSLGRLAGPVVVVVAHQRSVSPVGYRVRIVDA